ncbi:cytochrome C assembly family protein [Shewanella algicola]|jgi:ABC-type uncharacterized transport system permease subunit|uniref:Cytochrome c biogenesis protein CcsA n=1 Tax=Shewanella algicola TaxID=640633 RepID=A0A9X1Z7A0_9GAMM|nr:cytochrome c biogenesis protein CcsA [Shewanella algicola]MCL1107701.1 cytochrome c biogenesis protein CcsA [Shewanella algicola]
MVIFCSSAIFFYGLALMLVSSRLLHPDGPNRLAVTISAAIAVVLHAGILGHSIFMVDGQNFSLTNVISLVMWIITFTFTVLMFRLRLMIVVPIVYACSVMSVALLWLVPPVYITHFDLHPKIFAHVIMSLISYSTLLIAALYAIQLSAIQNKLKNKEFIRSPITPPLLTVEKQLFHLVMIGIVLLSISIATGFIFFENTFADGIGHKAVLSILAWLVYAAMLLQHYTIGCKIRTELIYTLTGAVLLTVAYFGARTVKELILS